MKFVRQIKRLATGVAVVAALIAMSGTVNADGMAPRGAAVVQQAPTNWSGLYFGVHSGWQWSSFDASINDVSVFRVEQDSPVVGGQIGIQHQWGNFVLGIEGSLTTAYRNDHASTDCPNAAFTCAARFDDVFTIGPRLGWAMGRWMPYITGGYANARFSEKISIKASSSNPFEDSQRHGGWFIGGGVDMALAAGWTVGLEYRHYDYDSATYNPSRNVTGGAFETQPSDVADVSTDMVTLRVSWKFDRPERAVVPLK